MKKFKKTAALILSAVLIMAGPLIDFGEPVMAGFFSFLLSFVGLCLFAVAAVFL